jgi:hypothetical protein
LVGLIKATLNHKITVLLVIILPCQLPQFEHSYLYVSAYFSFFLFRLFDSKWLPFMEICNIVFIVLKWCKLQFILDLQFFFSKKRFSAKEKSEVKELDYRFLSFTVASLWNVGKASSFWLCKHNWKGLNISITITET